jgi:hypothetical protein
MDKRSDKATTLIFLDYDDCIFPTTAVTRLMQEQNVDSFRDFKPTAEIWNIEMILIDIITILFEMCGVVTTIVTNASKGWVEYSCALVMPNLWSTLLYKFPVCYARYESQPSTNPFSWKYFAFSRLIENHTNITAILSVGDSSAERFAALSFIGFQFMVKSIKFVELPSVLQLTSQWIELKNCYEKLLDYQEDLDIILNSDLSITIPVSA